LISKRIDLNRFERVESRNSDIDILFH